MKRSVTHASGLSVTYVPGPYQAVGAGGDGEVMASSSALWLGARPSSSLRKGAGGRKLLGSGPQHNGGVRETKA